LKELRSRSKQEFKEPDICEWLEAACDANVADSKSCLLFVAELKKSQQWSFPKERIRAAEIVLADTGDLVAAQDAVIDGTTKDVQGVYRVEPLLLADSVARKVLVDILSVKSLDNDEWERRIRRSVANTHGHQGLRETLTWRKVWALLRVAPSAVLEKISDL
jgi:hypothetical protein